MELWEIASAGVGSVITWVTAKKWLFPLVVKWYKQWRENSLKYKSDLQAVEETGYTIYQSQIKFLNDEIESLQSIIKTKSDELKETYTELSKLRIKLKKIELALIHSQENEKHYRSMCCTKAPECPLRIACPEADDVVEDYVEDYEENQEVVK